MHSNTVSGSVNTADTQANMLLLIKGNMFKAVTLVVLIDYSLLIKGEKTQKLLFYDYT